MEVNIDNLLLDPIFDDPFEDDHFDISGMLFQYIKFVSIVALASLGTTVIAGFLKKLFPQRDTSHDAATVPEQEDVV